VRFSLSREGFRVVIYSIQGLRASLISSANRHLNHAKFKGPVMIAYPSSSKSKINALTDLNSFNSQVLLLKANFGFSRYIPVLKQLVEQHPKKSFYIFR